MSTTETSTTMNATRMLIDARLDAVDRALLGRVSRAERLDVVGEVESRIDELLRERCGPGAEPSREDVLAALARLDPPEAYLGDDESPPRAAEDRPAPRARVSPPDSPTPIGRTANASVIIGVMAACGSILFPIGWLVAIGSASGMFLLAFLGVTALGMIFGGGLALVLGLVERPRRPATLVGLIVGATTLGFGLAIACTALLVTFS